MVGTPKNMVLVRRRTEDRGLVEAVEHGGRRAGGQGAEEAGAEPVDVEERQAEDEPVVGLATPRPRAATRCPPAREPCVCTAPLGVPVVPEV